MSAVLKDSTLTMYQQRGFAGRVEFGERPAVLVVDAIVGFTDTKSPLAAAFDREVAAITELLSACRAKRVPAVFSTVAYDSSTADAGLFMKKVPSLSILAAGSRWVAVDERLGRQPGELLLVKKFASCFFGTHLASYLTSRGVDTLLITGFTTSGCVRASAVDALQNGFRAIVPRECVGDRAAGPHEASLFDIDAKYGDVLSLADTLEHLR